MWAHSDESILQDPAFQPRPYRRDGARPNLSSKPTIQPKHNRRHIARPRLATIPAADWYAEKAGQHQACADNKEPLRLDSQDGLPQGDGHAPAMDSTDDKPKKKRYNGGRYQQKKMRGQGNISNITLYVPSRDQLRGHTHENDDDASHHGAPEDSPGPKLSSGQGDSWTALKAIYDKAFAGKVYREDLEEHIRKHKYARSVALVIRQAANALHQANNALLCRQ